MCYCVCVSHASVYIEYNILAHPCQETHPQREREIYRERERERERERVYLRVAHGLGWNHEVVVIPQHIPTALILLRVSLITFRFSLHSITMVIFQLFALTVDTESLRGGLSGRGGRGGGLRRRFGRALPAPFSLSQTMPRRRVPVQPVQLALALTSVFVRQLCLPLASTLVLIFILIMGFPAIFGVFLITFK